MSHRPMVDKQRSSGCDCVLELRSKDLDMPRLIDIYHPLQKYFTRIESEA